MVSRPSKDLAFRRMQADAVLAMARIRRQSERRIAELLEAQDLDISAAQAGAMMVLFQAREPMTARQLATEMAVSEVTIGRFVKVLETKEWVGRKPDPSDARAQLLLPTKKARAALPRFIKVSNAVLDETFAGFDKAELSALVSTIDRVRSNLDG